MNIYYKINMMLSSVWTTLFLFTTFNLIVLYLPEALQPLRRHFISAHSEAREVKTDAKVLAYIVIRQSKALDDYKFVSLLA